MLFRFRLSERTDEFVVFLSLFFFTLFFFFFLERWGLEREAKEGKGLKMDAFDKPAL